MPDPTTLLPTCRADLIIRPLGEDGRFVVKDPLTGEFFQIGESEQFLLERFDGRSDSSAIRAAFVERFDEPLSEDDLDEFIELALSQGFLQSETGLHSNLELPG